MPARRHVGFYGLPSVLATRLVLLPLRLLLEAARLTYVWLFSPCPFAVASDQRPIHEGLRQVATQRKSFVQTLTHAP